MHFESFNIFKTHLVMTCFQHFRGSEPTACYFFTSTDFLR